jgi:large repetitive protein
MFIQGCNLNLPNSITVTSGNGGGGTTPASNLACSVAPVNSTAAVPGQPYALTVDASGGTAPYSVQGVQGNFGSFTNISRTYTNTTSNQIVVNDSVTVVDTNSNTASCGFSVTVAASGGSLTPSPLSCTLTLNSQAPIVNTNTVVSIVAQGGSGDLTFSDFTGGANATVVTALNQTSNTQATATVDYTQTGAETASVEVTDQAGDQASCGVVFGVRPAPTVTVTASPATTVQYGQPIGLAASTANFLQVPTITFATTEPGIKIVANGAVATVTATDFNAHNFVVNVTATNGSDVATAAESLSIQAALPLSCTIVPDSATHNIGDNVNVTVTASDGESLVIGAVTAGDGTLLSPAGIDPFTVRFPTSGLKTISTTATSATTGRSCNNGATLSTQVTISPALTCSVSVAQANPDIGQWFIVGAVLPSGFASGTVQITNIATNSNAPLEVAGYSDSTDLNAWIAFTASGTFPINVTVESQNGQSYTCTTTETIY